MAEFRSVSRARASDSSSERPDFALSQQATAAAMRSDACAASAASSRIALSSSAVGGSTPSCSAYAAIHSFAVIPSPCESARRSRERDRSGHDDLLRKAAHRDRRPCLEPLVPPQRARLELLAYAQ